MTRRRKWIVSSVLAALCVLAVLNRCDLLPDSRARSFAYVSGCECQHIGDHNYCDFSFRLADSPLAERPDGPHPELRRGGKWIHYSERNPLWSCDDIDHTWQPVRYSPDARDDASIQLPMDSGGWFLLIAIGVLVLWHGVPAVLAKWRAWRDARRASRIARALRRNSGE